VGAGHSPTLHVANSKHRDGRHPLTFPHIPNFDLAGVITEAGEGVRGWSAGDVVVAFLPMTAPGAAAEYVAAPAGPLAAAPRTGDLTDAAALPSAGLTAWQSLFKHAALQAGQSVLINGAGGAVGGYAIQLAKRAGATVTATGSARSIDRLRSYGADRIVDYTATPLLQAVAGQHFDVVLNLAPTSPEETARLHRLPHPGRPGRHRRLTAPLSTRPVPAAPRRDGAFRKDPVMSLPLLFGVPVRTM
jgi:NADPH:quinone reductase-like Zn-dependent oxidoreductase